VGYQWQEAKAPEWRKKLDACRVLVSSFEQGWSSHLFEGHLQFEILAEATLAVERKIFSISAIFWLRIG
jgi:hypothetical protein